MSDIIQITIEIIVSVFVVLGIFALIIYLAGNDK